jgi:hypothetical protein
MHGKMLLEENVNRALFSRELRVERSVLRKAMCISHSICVMYSLCRYISSIEFFILIK